MRLFLFTITMSRIIFSPLIFITSIFFGVHLFSLVLFVLLAITDFLDGSLARKFNLESEIGATLDPIADKVLLLSSLLTISLVTEDPFITFFSLIILIREFWVGGMREMAHKLSISNSLKVNLLGKLKTTIQFITISCFFIGFWIDNALILFLCNFLLFLTMLVTLLSGINYSQSFISNIRIHSK